MNALTRLVRVGLPSVPGVNQLPGVKKIPASQFEGVTVTGEPTAIDPRHAAAYERVCGFPRKDVLPVTYPHMMAFAQHMEIMADPRYPWQGMGGVHVENTITQTRGIARDEVLTSSVHVGAPRPHAKGRLLDFVSTVTSGDEVVWESVSSYLVRGKASTDAPSADAPGSTDLGPLPTATTTWRLDDGLGRRYARVSGDVNPIHIHPVSARALGFKRHIAHGMWTKAHCLAQVENRFPEAVKVEVAFKTPVFLPGEVGFGVEGSYGDLRFGLSSTRDGAPHLVGRVTAL